MYNTNPARVLQACTWGEAVEGFLHVYISVEDDVVILLAAGYGRILVAGQVATVTV